MKYLAICAGMQAANATFSCVWCKCPAEQRRDTSKSWCTIEDGARTIDEIKHLALVKNKDSKYGCIHQPLFPCIPIDYVIPDILHLFLRISDTLINLLILDLRRMDGIEKFRSQEFKLFSDQDLLCFGTLGVSDDVSLAVVSSAFFSWAFSNCWCFSKSSFNRAIF